MYVLCARPAREHRIVDTFIEFQAASVERQPKKPFCDSQLFVYARQIRTHRIRDTFKGFQAQRARIFRSPKRLVLCIFCALGPHGNTESWIHSLNFKLSALSASPKNPFAIHSCLITLGKYEHTESVLHSMDCKFGARTCLCV